MTAEPVPAAESADPSGTADAPVVVPADQRRRSLTVLAAVALGAVVLDQLTKHWVVTSIGPRLESGEGPIVLLGGLVKLTYLQNTGAAFSMGTSYTWIFSIIAVIVAIVIVRQSRRLGSIWWAVALGGLLGGLLGNLIDRITRPPGPGLGYVVDFIQVPNFAVFNVADSFITCSAVLMVILALRGVPFSGRS
jgi:signal peptidase II